MALLLETTLYNNQVVTYHRISEFKFTNINNVVIAKLDSFRDKDHRAFSSLPLRTLDIDFKWSGNMETLHKEAYDYIKTLQEWKDAVDV